jgi:hypothetical protein
LRIRAWPSTSSLTSRCAVDIGKPAERAISVSVVRGDAVPHGVHAVPQGDVLDIEVGLRLGGRGRGHAATSAAVRRAVLSATRRAAEVMMSRLPA